MLEDPQASQPSGTPESSDAASKREQHPQSYQVKLSEAEKDSYLVWRLIRELEAPAEEDSVTNDAGDPASQEEVGAQAAPSQPGPEKSGGPLETPDEVSARMQALFKAAFERAAKMTPEEIQEAHPGWRKFCAPSPSLNYTRWLTSVSFPPPLFIAPPGPGVSPGATLQFIDESMFPGEENNCNDDAGDSNDTEKGPPEKPSTESWGPRAN